MTDETPFAGTQPLVPAVDSQQPPPSSSPELEQLREADVLARSFLRVPEAAFLLRASVRTVWRLMADPKSGFPKARRVRGRTLLARDEVLRFMAEAASS